MNPFLVAFSVLAFLAVIGFAIILLDKGLKRGASRSVVSVRLQNTWHTGTERRIFRPGSNG